MIYAFPSIPLCTYVNKFKESINGEKRDNIFRKTRGPGESEGDFFLQKRKKKG